MSKLQNIEIEHHIDGSVVRWVITDTKYKAPTSGIVVMIDMALPEQYMEAVFSMADHMTELLTMAAEKLRNDMFNLNPKKDLRG